MTEADLREAGWTKNATGWIDPRSREEDKVEESTVVDAAGRAKKNRDGKTVTYKQVRARPIAWGYTFEEACHIQEAREA